MSSVTKNKFSVWSASYTWGHCDLRQPVSCYPCQCAMLERPVPLFTWACSLLVFTNPAVWLVPDWQLFFGSWHLFSVFGAGVTHAFVWKSTIINIWDFIYWLGWNWDLFYYEGRDVYFLNVGVSESSFPWMCVHDETHWNAHLCTHIWSCLKWLRYFNIFERIFWNIKSIMPTKAAFVLIKNTLKIVTLWNIIVWKSYFFYWNIFCKM